MLLAACNQTPQVVEKIVEKEVQVTVQVDKEVEKIVEKPVEVIKEVVKEVEKKVEVIVTATPVVVAAKTKEFKESPLMTEAVAAGKVPPLEQRIPKEPFIVGPGVIVEAKDLPDWKPGKYGGTLRSAHSVANWSPDFFVMGNEGLLDLPGHQQQKIQGNVFSDFKVSEDGKSITFYLARRHEVVGRHTGDHRRRALHLRRYSQEYRSDQDLPGRWKTGASAERPRTDDQHRWIRLPSR